MGNVQLLQGLYDAFAKGDVGTVLGAFAPDIEWYEAESNPYEPEGGAPFVGADSITNNLFVKLATEWDSFTVTPQRFHDAGDAVVVEGRYSGAYNTSGLKLDAQFCHVWTMRDGKVATFRQYADTAKFQDVMSAP